MRDANSEVIVDISKRDFIGSANFADDISLLDFIVRSAEETATATASKEDEGIFRDDHGDGSAQCEQDGLVKTCGTSDSAASDGDYVGGDSSGSSKL